MKISKELTAPVLNWATNNSNRFEKNGHKRQFGALKKLNAPQEVWEIKKQLVNFYQLQNAEADNFLPDFCGFITDGGKVHLHSDICHIKDKFFVRLNLMILKPLVGGMPIIGGEKLNIEENGSWMCEASKKAHECELVFGEKPRIVLSFGFVV